MKPCAVKTLLRSLRIPTQDGFANKAKGEQMTRKKNIKIGMLVALLLAAGGLTTAYARGQAEQSRRLEQANLLADFGLTTSSLDRIISAGSSSGFGGLWWVEPWDDASDDELVIMWYDSTEDNFHAALRAINASGNGYGTAQELRLPSGRILFAQTERWELLWEYVEDDEGVMEFRISPLGSVITPLSP